MQSLPSSLVAFKKGTSFSFDPRSVPSFKYPPLSYADCMRHMDELRYVLFRNNHTFSEESLVKQCDYLLQIAQSSSNTEKIVDVLLETALFLRAQVSKLPESPQRNAQRSNLLNSARTIAILLAEHGSSYYSITNTNQIKEASFYIDWMNESGIVLDSEKADLKECLKIAQQNNPERKLAAAYYNQLSGLGSEELIDDNTHSLYISCFN